MPIPALPMTPALARRLNGRPLVLLLDIDGTLSPIAPRPEHAAIPEETRQLLGDLAQLPHVHVVAMTGRAADDARRLLDVAGLWIIGSHGLEVARPDEAAIVSDRVQGFAPAVATAVARSREIARRDPGIVVEDKHWTLSVHYRLAPRELVPEISADVERIARDVGLRLTCGKEVLELRPPLDIDKGTASVKLAERLGALQAGASLLCAGDDRTDEDAFRALRVAQPSSVTVHVGNTSRAQSTLAEFYVEDTEAMGTLLIEVRGLQRIRTVEAPRGG